jgi:hypothetical protein
VPSGVILTLKQNTRGVFENTAAKLSHYAYIRLQMESIRMRTDLFQVIFKTENFTSNSHVNNNKQNTATFTSNVFTRPICFGRDIRSLAVNK